MAKANNLSQLMQQQYLHHNCFELGLNLISIENSINNNKNQLSQIEHLVVKTTQLSKSINKLYKFIMSILFTRIKFQVNASYSFEKLRNDNVAVQTLGTN